MLKVSAVSYLNTKPFLKGLQKTGLLFDLALSLEIPSKTADKLLHGLVDLALVPVGILPQLPHYHLVSDYCIGTLGAVKTVCLYSQVPLEEINTVVLDYHSQTSVRLVQILLKHHWHKKVQFVGGQVGFENQIRDTTAAVIIGDRTIGLEHRFRYVYDLGEAWHDFTQLPFVFATWVSIQTLPTAFVDDLNRSFAIGMEHIDEIVEQYEANYPSDFDIKQYLTHSISYTFDAPKRQALALFLEYIKDLTFPK